MSGFVVPSWMTLSSSDNFDQFVNNNVSLKIGQVVEINYPSDENNFKTITYNVLINEKNDSYNQFVLYNCQLVDKFGGLADYTNYTLRKNDKDISGVTEGEVESKDLLGSYVLVGLINGSAATPIILGGLPFIDLPDDSKRKLPTKEDGHCLTFEFNGVNLNINKDGELLVQKYGPTKSDGTLDTDLSNKDQANSFIQINKDGDIKLSTTNKEKIDEADNIVTIKKDGSIEIKIKDGKNLLLKDKDGDAQMTLGDGAKTVAIAEELKNMYDQLKQKLDAADNHQHPSGMGPTGTPTITVGAPSWNDAINSKSMKLPK